MHQGWRVHSCSPGENTSKSHPVCVMHRVLQVQIWASFKPRTWGRMGGARGGCTCNSVTRMEVSPAFVITSSCLVTRRQLSLCQSHLRLLKLCHAWKLSQSSLAQMLQNQTNAAAPGPPSKLLLLLLHSRMNDCQVTSVFIVYRPSNL